MPSDDQVSTSTRPMRPLQLAPSETASAVTLRIVTLTRSRFTGPLQTNARSTSTTLPPPPGGGAGGGFGGGVVVPTTAVAAEVAEVEPAALDAVRTTRMRATDVCRAEEVRRADRAPPTVTHALPAESHRDQR